MKRTILAIFLGLGVLQLCAMNDQGDKPHYRFKNDNEQQDNQDICLLVDHMVIIKALELSNNDEIKKKNGLTNESCTLLKKIELEPWIIYGRQFFEEKTCVTEKLLYNRFRNKTDTEINRINQEVMNQLRSISPLFIEEGDE